MSEVKLNLIDSRETLHGTIHGSVADAAIAALSAQPETIAELQAALARYIKPREAVSPFASFCSTKLNLLSDCVGIDLPRSSPGSPSGQPAWGGGLDLEPWDAGIVVIDLAARIVAAESTYSLPGASGEVQYHDGTHSTDVAVPYRVSDDWLFVSSLAEYECSHGRRRMERTTRPALDARTVLYGHALLEFIVNDIRQTFVCRENLITGIGPGSPAGQCGVPGRAARLGCHTRWDGGSDRVAPVIDAGSSALVHNQEDHPRAYLDESNQEALATEISDIHARWLMTPREDLRGQSPRDVLLVSQDFIDFDLHTRELQWTFQGEGPPCLAHDSYAYKFAGFGTHEWVVYYDLMRHLLWSALENVRQASVCRDRGVIDKVQFVGQSEDSLGIDLEPVRIDSEIARLEAIKTSWLEQPQRDYDGRIPAIIIENERKRLPLALRPRDMIVDEDCPMCQMFGDETTLLGMGVGFWHLDGSHMDDDFAFSYYKTREEWEAENRRREEFNKEFNRRWEERQQRIARGEALEPDPFFDPDPFPDFEFDDSSLVSSESIDDDEKEFPQ